MMIPYSWILQAQERIAPHIHKTPLTYDADQNWYLKWENQQTTGSFKIRGALAKILSLLPWERARGIVTASAGNHGQGVALAGQLTGTRVIVFAAETALPVKLEAMRTLGAEVRLVAGGYGEAEQAAIAYAQSHQSVWISPYNDGQVIAGQGTLALEILNEMPEAAGMTWIVPTGGGGLLAGIGAVLKSRPEPKFLPGRLLGVQSHSSAFMHALFHTGTQDGILEQPSLADGLAGPVEKGSVTIPLVRKYADDFLLVNEQAIEAAIQYAWQHYGERIEGSAAASLAASMAKVDRERPAMIIISGGNIQPEIYAKIIDQ